MWSFFVKNLCRNNLIPLVGRGALGKNRVASASIIIIIIRIMSVIIK